MLASFEISLVGTFEADVRKICLPEVIEAATGPKGAFANIRVVNATAALAAGKAAHAAAVAFRAEPCTALGRCSGQAGTAEMESAKTGPATDDQTFRRVTQDYFPPPYKQTGVPTLVVNTQQDFHRLHMHGIESSRACACGQLMPLGEL